MKMIFKIEKLWDVIIASGTIATTFAATRITTTIKAIETITTTSSSFSSMEAQWPMTKANLCTLGPKKQGNGHTLSFC